MKILKKIQNSLQYKIFTFSFILILCTVLIISIFSYNKSVETIEKNLGEYTFQIVEQVNSNIEFYIKDMDNISSICNYNYYIQKYLKNMKPENDLERFKDANKISEIMNAMISVRDDIVSVFLFGNNGFVLRIKPEQKLIDNFRIEEYGWYKEALNNMGSAYISPPHLQTYLKDSRKSVVSLSRMITNYDSLQSIGIVLIDLNTRIIEDICSNIKLGEKGYIYILDEKGNIVYHPDKFSVYDEIDDQYKEDILNAENGSFIKSINNEKALITFTTSKITNWKVVGIASVEEMITGSIEMRKYIFFIGVISIVLLFFIVAYISSRITENVTDLESKMKAAEEGNLEVSSDIEGGDEIARLSRRFNKMIKRINELMKQVFDEQEELRITELQLLQSQINPHFLYNTLDSIIWMAEGNKNEEVIEMVSALAKLFRISLSKGKDVILVKDEVEHVKSYLIIQKKRYKSKLDYIFEINPEIYNCYSLKLILQPLVENSIYHGIKNKNGKGIIKICGDIEEDKLIFKIIDNGVGMSKDKLENILNNTIEDKKYNGVAVKNVIDRIKVYFGEEYGINYKSVLGKGTKVEIRLPIIRDWERNKLYEKQNH